AVRRADGERTAAVVVVRARARRRHRRDRDLHQHRHRAPRRARCGRAGGGRAACRRRRRAPVRLVRLVLGAGGMRRAAAARTGVRRDRAAHPLLRPRTARLDSPGPLRPERTAPRTSALSRRRAVAHSPGSGCAPAADSATETKRAALRRRLRRDAPRQSSKTSSSCSLQENPRVLVEFRNRALLAALCGLAAPIAWAQESAETTTLRRVTVTDSAIEDRFDADDTDPVSRVRYDAPEVERQHAKNLIEILRSVPGVTADLQSDGETIKIKLRGIENQRFRGEKPGVSIVVDGVPVFERTGKVNVDLDNIERIEVVKGGASYLYGDDALAGAVIVTTKRGAGQRGLRFDADRGAFGYRRHLLHAGHAGDALVAHLQYAEREQDGYYFLSSSRARTWSGSLQYALDERSELAFGFERSARFRDREGSITGVTAARTDPRGRNEGRGYTRNFDVDLTRWNLRWSRDLDERSNLLAVVYEYRDETTYWSAPMRFDASGQPTTNVLDYSTLNDFRQAQRGAKAEYRATFDAFALMGGIDLRRNAFENEAVALNAFRTTPHGAATPAGTLLSDDRTRERMRAAYGEAKLALGASTVATFNVRRDLVDVDFDAAAVAGNG